LALVETALPTLTFSVVLAAFGSFAGSALTRTFVAATLFCSNLAASEAGMDIALGFFFWIRGTGGTTGLSTSLASLC
jgi:hypothetical protein